MIYFPLHIIQQYNLHKKVDSDGYVYIKIPKEGVHFKTIISIFIQQLRKNIAPRGYIPCKYSTVLLWHAKKKNCVCVENFGVKHFFDTEADNPLNNLENITKYPSTLKGRTTVDWPFTGITTRNMSKFPFQLTSPNPSNFPTSCPKNFMLCTPQIDSSSIWPNNSAWKSTRQHTTYWLKRHQRHTSQGHIITVFLTISLSNHVAYFKLDRC